MPDIRPATTQWHSVIIAARTSRVASLASSQTNPAESVHVPLARRTRALSKCRESAPLKRDRIDPADPTWLRGPPVDETFPDATESMDGSWRLVALSYGHLYAMRSESPYELWRRAE